MKKYDYLIVGAGLYGAVMAYELGKRGKKCLVIDRRDHIAGNIYCQDMESIHVHKYGAHIFHTSDKKVWDYINQFAECLTTTSILRLLFIRTSFTTCRLI